MGKKKYTFDRISEILYVDSSYGPFKVFSCENKKMEKKKKLSLSHASGLTGLVTQSGLETNTSSRMMTHHPAWQTQNAAVSASGQWSCCLGAGSVFVPCWLSRLRDNSADNSWDQRLSLSHREIWFPPSAWSHGLPRAFLLPPQERSLGHGSWSQGNSLSV